jgi:NDP-sugar pyrophosphorylase family protein
MGIEIEKPVLVIMAAGMGSRYGGLKQIDPVDEAGHIIIDFSMYDARKAGFEKVIFIIKRENEEDFKHAIGDRIARYMDVSYAYQELDALPENYTVPQGRAKPWGTAHAVLSCKELIHGPFAVINADDYYGREAFSLIYDYLQSHSDDEKYRYAMVGYHLGNTVTEHGHVARGICETNEKGELTGICERTRIEKKEGGIAYSEDEGATWVSVPAETIVSMNMWGFSHSFLDEIERGFPAFLERGLAENPLKCEYFLPSVVSSLLESDRATVEVLPTTEKWYGVTYKEDKPVVVEAIRRMKEAGVYPADLWEETR